MREPHIGSLGHLRGIYIGQGALLSLRYLLGKCTPIVLCQWYQQPRLSSVPHATDRGDATALPGS